MSLSSENIYLLRKFCSFRCEECHKHEREVGVLQPHRINQNLDYFLANIKLVCSSCHEIFSSAQRMSIGAQK